MTQFASEKPVIQSPSQQLFSSKFGRYKDICAALNISRSTLWRWNQQPGFPRAIKRGNTVLFDLEALEIWLVGEES